MIINNNISAMNAYRNLTTVNERTNKTMEKLSSGMRINRAADDAAGLAISEKMRGQIRGLNMATKNAQDGISLIQTAEGGLNESHAILQRMRELAVQSANDTNTDEDRGNLQMEMNQLRQELDRISNATEFNTKKLITGTYAENGLVFHIGANKDQIVNLKFNDMSATALGVNGSEQDTSISIISQKDANNAIKEINSAIEQVSEERAKYGAMQNRLEHTINNLRVAEENLQASESRIRDADMAKVISSYTADKIMMNSGVSVQIHSNTTPENILRLMGA